MFSYSNFWLALPLADPDWKFQCTELFLAEICQWSHKRTPCKCLLLTFLLESFILLLLCTQLIFQPYGFLIIVITQVLVKFYDCLFINYEGKIQNKGMYRYKTVSTSKTSYLVKHIHVNQLIKLFLHNY